MSKVQIDRRKGFFDTCFKIVFDDCFDNFLMIFFDDFIDDYQHQTILRKGFPR